MPSSTDPQHCVEVPPRSKEPPPSLWDEPTETAQHAYPAYSAYPVCAVCPCMRSVSRTHTHPRTRVSRVRTRARAGADTTEDPETPALPPRRPVRAYSILSTRYFWFCFGADGCRFALGFGWFGAGFGAVIVCPFDVHWCPGGVLFVRWWWGGFSPHWRLL
jgi:hypothetical protein